MRDKLIEKILPAYPFVQYRDDDNIVAFFDAHNQLAQHYLTTFNQLNLGFWPGQIIKGALLDWIALGIYGVNRQKIINIDYQDIQGSLPENLKTKGIYDTIEYNAVAYNEVKNRAVITVQSMSDDFFKRVLLWNFFKADGFQFSMPWLKRRIARFFYCKNGDPFDLVDEAIDSGIVLTAFSVKPKQGIFTVTVDTTVIPNQEIFDFFKRCLETRIVNLPFQYTFLVLKK